MPRPQPLRSPDSKPFFLGVEHHRRVQTAQANFGPVSGRGPCAWSAKICTNRSWKKKLCPWLSNFQLGKRPLHPESFFVFCLVLGQPHMRHLTFELCSQDTLNFYTCSRIVIPWLGICCENIKNL